MNHYAQPIWKFEVYGPFGRVYKAFPFGPDETHHRAAKEAYKYRKQCGKRAWVRLVKHA